MSNVFLSMESVFKNRVQHNKYQLEFYIENITGIDWVSHRISDVRSYAKLCSPGFNLAQIIHFSVDLFSIFVFEYHTL